MDYRLTFLSFQVDELKCVSKCPRGFLKLESGQDRKCVKACPAGYQKEAPWAAGECVKCKVEKCPRGRLVFAPARHHCNPRVYTVYI